MRANVRYLLYRQLVNDDLLSEVKIGILCKKMLNLLEIMVVVKNYVWLCAIGWELSWKKFHDF